MADRYWVGGAGLWDASNTANWSATSGGAGGASIPGLADTAIFDANSGSGDVTNPGGSRSIRSINTTGFQGSFVGASIALQGGTGSCIITAPMPAGYITIYHGTFSLSVTNAINAGVNGLYINVGGSVSNTTVTLSGPIGVHTLNVNAPTASYSCGLFTNNHDITCYGNCALFGNQDTLGSSRIRSYAITMSANAVPGTAEFATTGAFTGVSGKTYSKVTLASIRNAGSNHYIAGTGYTIDTLNQEVVPNGISFQNNSTVAVNNFNVFGQAGSLVYIQPATEQTGFNFTLVKGGGGIVSSDYLRLHFCNASPANTWYAGANSVNAGSNANWIFAAAPAPANVNRSNLLFASL